jgi:hypothetical protein
MDDHKLLAIGEGSPAILDKVPELSAAASTERCRQTERQQAVATSASARGRQPMGREPT